MNKNPLLDLEALKKHGRRVMHVNLGPDISRGLAILIENHKSDLISYQAMP